MAQYSTQDGFFDDARELIKRARKIKPLQVLGREVGITPKTQQLRIVDTEQPSSGFDTNKALLWGGGGLLLAKILKLI